MKILTAVGFLWIGLQSQVALGQAPQPGPEVQKLAY
jgi:hypothetical protein